MSISKKVFEYHVTGVLGADGAHAWPPETVAAEHQDHARDEWIVCMQDGKQLRHYLPTIRAIIVELTPGQNTTRQPNGKLEEWTGDFWIYAYPDRQRQLTPLEFVELFVEEAHA